MREAIKDLCGFVKKSGKPIEKIQVFSGKKEKLESIKNKLEPFDVIIYESSSIPRIFAGSPSRHRPVTGTTWIPFAYTSRKASFVTFVIGFILFCKAAKLNK